MRRSTAPRVLRPKRVAARAIGASLSISPLALAACLAVSASWACQSEETKDTLKTQDTAADCEPTDEIPYDWIDQDCDGADLTDVDGDGQDSTEVGGRDCDDTDPEVHAGNAEECNGIDDDCDGLIDAEDTYNLVDGEAAYRDEDGDGYGDPDTETVVCEIPSGWTTTSGDCDDGDAAVYPGAEEICDDGIDNNCSGWDAGCDEPTVITTTAKFTGENTDGYAGRAQGSGDLNGDGFDDLVVGADLYAGYFILGGPPGTRTGTQSLSTADVTLIGERGCRVAGLGDTDRDGLDDFIIGTDAGSDEALLFLGSTLSGSSGWLMTSAADAALVTSLTCPAVAGAGDTNGDGFEDILIQGGGPDHGHHWGYSGCASVVLGPVSGSHDIEDMARLAGVAPGDYCGMAVAGVGDTNADGFDDVSMVCTGVEGGRGAAYVGLGPIAEVRYFTDADAALVGGDGGTLQDVAGAGDVNGDGFDDVLVGIPFVDAGPHEWVGEVLLFHGPVAGQYAPSDAVAKLFGEYGGGAGIHLSGAGDVNDDGVSDIMVGMPWSSTTADRNGALYVVLGPLSGTSGLANADFRFDGDAAGDGAGIPASAGDFDGDGFDDLVVGALYESSVANDAGAAYLILNTELYP